MATRADYLDRVGNSATWEAWEDAGGDNIAAHVSAIYDDVTEQEVQAAYEKWKDTAKSSGVSRGVAGVAPKKADLLTKAEHTPTWLAFSEIVDNILENYRKNALASIKNGELPNNLEVKISVHSADKPFIEADNNWSNSCQILIKENSGGIEWDSLQGFLSMGYSDWDPKIEGSVGVWGNGQKVAMCKLGRYNTVGSVHKDDDKGIWFDLGGKEKPHGHGGNASDNTHKDPRNYYHEDNSNWEVNIDGVHPDQIGELLGRMHTTLRKVPESAVDELANEDKWKEVNSQLSAVFANKNRENIEKFSSAMEENDVDGDLPSMSVVFTNTIFAGSFDVLDPDETLLGEFQEADGDFDRLLETMVYIPGMRPRMGEIKIPAEAIGAGTKEDLHISWLIGLRENVPAKGGFTMWGNGKMFQDCFFEIERLPGAFIKLGAGQHRHWKGYLKFWSKDPSLIPWSAPTKWEFTHESKAKKIIGNFMSVLATPYWTASKDLGDYAKLREVQGFFNSWAEED